MVKRYDQCVVVEPNGNLRTANNSLRVYTVEKVISLLNNRIHIQLFHIKNVGFNEHGYVVEPLHTDRTLKLQRQRNINWQGNEQLAWACALRNKALYMEENANKEV